VKESRICPIIGKKAWEIEEFSLNQREIKNLKLIYESEIRE
jgi:hypothetical protein